MRKMLQSIVNKSGYRIEKVRGLIPGPHLNVANLLLHVLNKHRSGNVSFVQVGANDGQVADPLYQWITRYPWRGVLVEPQPAMYRKLIELHSSRPQISIEQAVVSDKRGKAQLWTLGDADDLPKAASLFSSLNKDAFLKNVQRSLPDFAHRAGPVEVDAYTLGDLMEKHGLTELDLLQIDAEGFDFQIIKMIDFAKCRPQIINYEISSMTVDDRRACRTYLASFGYSFADSDLGDTVACQGDLLNLI